MPEELNSQYINKNNEDGPDNYEPLPDNLIISTSSDFMITIVTHRYKSKHEPNSRGTDVLDYQNLPQRFSVIIMLVSFAGISPIRFNGSRINGLSHKALRQDAEKYKLNGSNLTRDIFFIFSSYHTKGKYKLKYLKTAS